MKHVKPISVSRAQAEADPRVQAILDAMVGQILQLIVSIGMLQAIKAEE